VPPPTCTVRSCATAYHDRMTEEDKSPPHHHSLRERIDAAEAAADEVVSEESGQLGSEVGALAVPFEEIAAAVRAAIHPHDLAEQEVVRDDAAVPDDEDAPAPAEPADS
jgi:hypothetical protein